MKLTLAAYVGESVTIRYDPRDMAEIRVFYNNQFLCSAICSELVDKQINFKDIIQARNRRRKQLNYFAAPPLSEFFMYDDEDGPVLVARICPYKDMTGNFPSPGERPLLPDIKIDPALVSGYSIGKTVQEVLNFFFCFSDIAGNDGSSTAPMYASPSIDLSKINPYVGSGTGSNPAWVPESTDKFGLRTVNVSTPYLNPVAQGNNNSQPEINVDMAQVQMAAELSTWMRDVYGHNEKLLSGTLTCHGSEELIPGRYFTFNNMTAYIEQVSEFFQFVGSANPSWTANVIFTRGLKN